jgi:hypothetical protein
MKKVALVWLAGMVLASSCWAQSSEAPTPKSDGPDVRFVDSPDAYWVNKSVNDTLYYGAGGSFNAARHERDQFRDDQALLRIYKPTKTVEIKSSGKAQTAPVLRMNGKEVQVP